jgi:hypothetical protein
MGTPKNRFPSELKSQKHKAGACAAPHKQLNEELPNSINSEFTHQPKP